MTVESNKLCLTLSVVCVVVVPWLKFKGISTILDPHFSPIEVYELSICFSQFRNNYRFGPS